MLISNKYSQYSTITIFLIILALITGPAIPDILMTSLTLFGIYLILKKKIIINNSNFYYLISGYLIIFISLFFSTNFKISFLEFIVDIRYFLYLYFFSYFFLEKYLNHFINFCLIIIFFLFFDLILQYNLGFDIFGFEPNLQVNRQRLNGPFGDEYIIGTYIFKLSLPVIGYYLHKKNLLLFFITLLISLISIILSGERMALILFTFGVILILIFMGEKNKLFLFIVIFSILFAISFYYFPEKRFKYIEFFDAIINFRDSGHGAHYLAALKIFLDDPFTGSGFKTFRIVCSNPDVVAFVSSKSATCSTHPHNLYLETLSETGIIGFVGLLVLIVYFIKKIVISNLHKTEFVGFVALFICIFWPFSSISNIFNNWNATLNFTLLGFLLIKNTEVFLNTSLKK